MEPTLYDLARLRQTLLGLVLILAVAGLAALGWQLGDAPSVRAAGPHTVNSTNDDADVDIGDGLCRTAKGECTLRAAIDQANYDGGAETINITATGTITLGSDLPNIYTNLTIVGPGAGRLTIHGANSYRPFYIWSGSTVVISGLTLTRGNGGGGGAVYNDFGTLSINDCIVSYNTATSSGGGVYNYGGTLVVKSTRIYSNTTTNNGGGLYNSMGNVTIEDSIISGNTAEYYGGGVYDGGGLTLKSSIISRNVASNAIGRGGGLYLSYSDADLTNSVVTDNQSNGGGSGIYISGAAPHLRHTTIARNTGGDGSGIYVASGSTPILTNTILVFQQVGITVTSGSTAALNGVLAFNNGLNTGGAGVVSVTQAYTGNPAFAADGYHLTVGSMAIDRGIQAGVNTDIDGDLRDTVPDLGADEYRSGPDEARTRVNPVLGGLLVYTDSRGLSTTVQFPPGALLDTTDIVYTAVPSPTEPISPSLRLAGRAFDLKAYRNGTLVSGPTFARAVTVTIHYAGEDVAGIFEDTLRLYRWMLLSGWQVIEARPGEGQILDTANRVLTAWLRSFTRYGELGVGKNDIYLPLIIRDG